MTEVGVQVLQYCVPLDLSEDLIRVATKLGVSGESVRRDVPADEMDTIRFEEHDERDYKKKCKAYFGKDPIFINEDEEYAKHLAKFFKGEVE